MNDAYGALACWLKKEPGFITSIYYLGEELPGLHGKYMYKM